MRLSAFTLVLALAVLFAGVGKTTDFSVATARLSSGLSAKFHLNQPIYIEVHYSSTERLRFQAHAYRDGKSVEEGQLMNGAVAHPSGGGSALAWVAFRYPAAVDEIRITTFDGDWKPLDIQSLKADLTWSGRTGVANERQPTWVTALQIKQSRIAAIPEKVSKTSDIGLLVSLVGLTMMVGVPGYFVIQFIAAHNLRGRWRLAALAPLALTVPATGHVVFAVATGENPWSFAAMSCVSAAFVYLLALYTIASMIRFYPSAAPLQTTPA